MATQYQVGGWYDQGGKNQRFLGNGQWTTDPNAPMSGSSNGGDPFAQSLSMFNDQTNKYIDSLLADAGGDKDFAIKQLTRNHELALGNNDQETAKFLESVADALEAKIGTIPYDYQIATARVNENKDITIGRTQSNLDKVLSRLSENEKVWKEQFATDSKNARQGQNESLSSRGLIQGTRENAQGIAGLEVGNFEKDLTNQLSTYDRLLNRERADATTDATNTINDTNLQAMRDLADLKTDARRGAISEQDALSYGTEAAQRKFDAQKKALEEKRKLILQQNPTNAQQMQTWSNQ